MSRILVDASTLIALAKIGRLDILQKTSPTIHTTRVIHAEVLEGDSPDIATLEAGFLDGWIKIIPRPRNKSTEPWERYGLGPGEASLFSVAKKKDLLVVDDRNARRFADARGYNHVGLLGLLVAGAKANRLDPNDALKVLDRLTTSDFRMHVDLYLWTKREMEKLQ